MSSIATGNKLEEAIFSFFRNEIDGERFFAKQSLCKLFRRKGYYSRDRKTEIIFDVSIELFLPGATDYSILFLIECKNYTHPVPVDDVEEFFAKVEQVGAANTKAVMASTASFQSGAREYAKSKGMGLLRYFDAQNFKWELLRSPSASARGISRDAEQQVHEGLEQPAFQSEVFDLFIQSPTRVTNSLWDLFDDLIATTTLPPAQVRDFTNRRDRQANAVPFIEKEQLEAMADEALDAVAYETGQVCLDTICRREAQRTGLVVESGGCAPDSRSRNPPLGRIQFAPLRIQIFASLNPHPERARFTLAHELAHHLLRHGRFMSREYCDESDFVLNRPRINNGTDIARLEFQANYFAASLLMPRRSFVAYFWFVLKELGIRDRGFGPLYVDSQDCNLRSYHLVTSTLMNQYKVSRISATIRLEGLGLLRDARKSEGTPFQDDLLHAFEGLTSASNDWR